jgi:hypothetical protein
MEAFLSRRLKNILGRIMPAPLKVTKMAVKLIIMALYRA